MAAQKSKRSSKTSRGCILAEAHFNRLQLLHEQVAGLTELLFERLQTEIEKDGPAITAYSVIKEKAREAFKLAGAGFGTLDAARLEVVVKNAPDPYTDASSPFFPDAEGLKP